jgi:23S rRNA-/tRNA-specific pseudouridylate synthase
MLDASGVRIVHQDNHLLVLEKPTGLSTTSPDGTNCLASLARELDPHAPRMHASSRLDAEVTGLVTFARTERAIAALLQARRDGAYRRLYLGLSDRALSPTSGTFDWAIGLDARDPRKRVPLPAGDARGQVALSRYEVRCALPQVALFALRPETGRTHQLRVHVAKAGAPLLGDRPYGGTQRIVCDDGRVIRARRVMLHCARVEVPAVEGSENHVFVAPVPSDFRELFASLGGDATLLDA